MRRIVEGYPKTREHAVLDLAPPTLKKSGIFHDSTRPQLHFDGLPLKSRRSVVSMTLGALQVLVYYRKKNSRFGLAWSHPHADRGLSRPTSVFCTTTGVCKILSRSVEIRKYEGQKPVSE